MLIGQVVIYAGGLSWLAYYVGIAHAAPRGMLPFLPGDAFKLVLAALALPGGWRRMAAFGPAVMIFAAAGAVFDAIEDVGLLLAVDRHGGDLAPRVAQVCASLKFGLLAVTIVYLLVGLLLRFRTRSA